MSTVLEAGSVTASADADIDTDVYTDITYGLAEADDGTYYVSGRIEGLAALRQAVWLLLNIERGAWKIFSDEYGIELYDLPGKKAEYIKPELVRRLQEALCCDERITDVDDINITVNGSGVHASFVVRSVYGDIDGETEVMADV